MRRSFCANSKCKNCVLKDPLVRNNHSINLTRKKGTADNFIAVCNSNQVADVLTYESSGFISAYCHQCKKIEKFKVNSKKKRINGTITLDVDLNSLKTVLSSVHIATCTKCGETLEYNPASFTDVGLTRKLESFAPYKQDIVKIEASNKQDLAR